MSKTFYITTAIAYPNAKPHIGHAMELIQADCIARYKRLQLGVDNVYFLTGTDEHGMKIVETATAEGIRPQELVDRNSALFKELSALLNISNDDFIRTSETRHKGGAAALWRKLREAGDIYKGIYKGLYCVGCEAYVLEKDLIDGKCSNHRKPPVAFEEENYFFKLTKWIPEIRKLITSNAFRIVPESRKHEILNLLDDAEKERRDVSFSRPRKALSWGIPVPDDPEQTMYVWCDALSNYLTALDYEHEGALYKKCWPADVHLIGKDIVRFHAGYWPAMLLSAKVPLPKAIYTHGFITVEGQKMSKSLNNVIDPVELVKKYGADAVRYYLLREVPTTDDGDFSATRFEIVYNSELANNFGNLVHRVTVMTHNYFGGKMPHAPLNGPLQTLFKKTRSEYEHSMEDFNIKEAMEVTVGFLTALNQHIEEEKPWVLAKSDTSKLASVMTTLIEGIRSACILLYPIIPHTVESVLKQYNTTIESAATAKELNHFFAEGHRMEKGAPLFPKLG